MCFFGHSKWEVVKWEYGTPRGGYAWEPPEKLYGFTRVWERCTACGMHRAITKVPATVQG